jgi:thymidylate synthase (FAD)
MKITRQCFEIEQISSNILELIEKCGRVCYKSEDKITKGSAKKFIENILKRKHESVLEHGVMTIRFVISRAIANELVRHRLASFSQESTRYVSSKNNFTCILPVWFELPWPIDVELQCDDQNQILRDFCTKHRQTKTFEEEYLWFQTMAEVENRYAKFLSFGWRKEQARGVLPNDLKTEIIITANVREWRHIFKLRCAKGAHPQMREIMKNCLEEVQRKIPVLFDDIS